LLQRTQQAAVEGAHDAAPKAVARGPRASHIGNQAQLCRLEAKMAPADLRIGAVDDPLEREADAVAGRQDDRRVGIWRQAMKAGGKQAKDEQTKITRASPAAAPPRDATGLLELQRAVGNRAVHSLLSTPGVVQRRAIPSATASATPQATAARATGGTGARLPYLQQIQASFGRHDVSHVKAFTGGAAALAAGELGARAFAYGDRVAFASRPDLRTAAHEAAHVVQQGSGAGLEGGIDTPGDALEQHADAVADAVVSGKSAEPLLDDLGGGGGLASPVVQRQAGSIPPPVVYLRKRGEIPDRKRALRRTLTARVRDIPTLEMDLLVEAYGLPPDRPHEIDLLPIEVDPPGSPGITQADLQGSAGLVQIGVSPKLDEYLRDLAGRASTSDVHGPGSPKPAPGQPDKPAPHPTGPQGQVPHGQGPRGQGQPAPGHADKTAEGVKTGKPEGTGKIEIPDRLKSLFPEQKLFLDEAGRAKMQKAIDLLMAMSDEDVSQFALVATHLTKNPERFLASIELFKRIKAEQASILEQALQDAAKNPGPLLDADRDPSDGPIDPAQFKRWSPDDKERIARERMAKLRNKQLLEMAKNPGKTAKEMGKAIARPDLQVADVNKAIQEARDSKGGWDTASKVTSAGSKFTGMIASVLAILAVVSLIAIPGVDVAFLMSSSMMMMMASAMLAQTAAEMHIKAAGQATNIDQYNEHVAAGAEDQVRGWMTLAAMGAGIGAGLLGKIPLGARLGTVGDALTLARATVAKAIGTAWKGARAQVATSLRMAMSGLQEALIREMAPLAALKAKLDGMTAAVFYEQLKSDKWLRASFGLDEQTATNLAELTKTPQGKAAGVELFEETRAALGDGPAIAQRELDKVLASVEKSAKQLEGAATKEEFEKALGAAEQDLDNASLGVAMSEEGAKHTAAKLKQLTEKHGVKLPDDAKAGAAAEPGGAKPGDAPKASEAKKPDAPKAGDTPKPTEAAAPKAWDDPTMTEAEFMADYRKRAPTSRKNDTELREIYKSGQRLNPSKKLVDPKRDPKVKPFEERKDAMGEREKKAREAAEKDPKAKPTSTEYDGELSRLQSEGVLGASDVAALTKWSRAFALFKQLGGKLSARDLLAGLKKGYSESAYINFRHRLFDGIVDLILGREGGGRPTRLPRDQANMLREFLGEGLEVMPDSASKGSLNAKYRAARFSDPSGDIKTIESVKKSFDNPNKVKLDKARDADGAMSVRNQELHGGPKDGEYAVDDKAGFSNDPGQLKDVNALMGPDGIMTGGKLMAGVIYWCENEGNAAALVAKLRGMSQRFYVAFMDANGDIQWVKR
jgi:hypothetical protein